MCDSTFDSQLRGSLGSANKESHKAGVMGHRVDKNQDVSTTEGLDDGLMCFTQLCAILVPVDVHFFFLHFNTISSIFAFEHIHFSWELPQNRPLRRRHSESE